MKNKLVLLISIVVCILSIHTRLVNASTPFVEDNANVMSQELIDKVRAINQSFKELTNKPELMVITINNLPDDETINEYATRRFDELKIGNVDYDSGVMYILDVNDRKSRIEVGYGLEDIIPDSYTNVITDSNVKELFKSGDYDAGLNLVVDNISTTINNSQINDSDNNVSKGEQHYRIKSILYKILASIPLALLFTYVFIKRRNNDDDDYHTPSSGSTNSFGGFTSFDSSSSSSFDNSNNDWSGGGGSSGGGGGNSDW